MSNTQITERSVKMCRCCGRFKLAKSEQFVRLFEPEQHRVLIENIRSELLNCWKMKVAKNNGLPQHICSKCLQQFDSFFNFRAFCVLAQDRLTNFYQRITNSLPANRNVQEKNSMKKPNPQQSNLCTSVKRKISVQGVETQQRITGTTTKKTEIKIVSAAKGSNIRPCLPQTKSINFASEEPALLTSIEFVELPNYIKLDKGSLTTNNKNNDIKVLECALSECNPDVTKDIVECIEGLPTSSRKQFDHQEDFNAEIVSDTVHYTLQNNDELTPTVDTESFNFDKSLEHSNWSGSEEFLSDDEYDESEAGTKQEMITFRKLKQNPLACKYCCFNNEISPNEIIFPSEDALNAHIKMQHNSETPYTCPICKKSYKALSSCKGHILYTHKRSKSICSICGVEINSAYVRAHVYFRHTYADFQCETCGKNFPNSTVAKFEYHRRWHNAQKQYKCEFCGKSFVQNIHLKTHMAIHTKIYRINCEKCGKGFNSQYDKGKHMYHAHGEAKPVKCLYCEERFLVYDKRNLHMLENHGHVQKTVNEQLECFKCHKVFKREAGLRHHMESDCLDPKIQEKHNLSKNKPFQRAERKYACPYCSCRFVKQSGLVQHLPLHSSEGRPFQCDICKLHYKTQSHLDIHTRQIHTNERPFPCDVCGKLFSFKFHMNSHRKFHEVAAKKREPKVLKI